jgi:CDP-glucose 4,6-dehydratase
LAAQPLVRLSYAEPRKTFETNVLGTVNVLDAVRHNDTVKACLVVTSDKCYENREWERGYRESDPMGGYDPYSASKGCAELVTASYRRSFFLKADGQRLASARAGNVIGGGDWSVDRIVTDFVTNILADRPLKLRNPKATRPWQHVLEPLSGYLHLAAQLMSAEGYRYAEGWNFGPADSSVIPVVELASLLCKTWGRGEVIVQANPNQPHEAGLLKLDSSKARVQLGWSPVWNVSDAVSATVEWYREFSQGAEAWELTQRQLESYCRAAREQRAAWTEPKEQENAWKPENKNFAAKSLSLRAS